MSASDGNKHPAPPIPEERRRRISLTQSRRVPDPIRLARYSRAPEIGPTVLFFSGGSALRKTSRVLTEYTHNSIHLITPFDSGGSSAKLRDAFPMISVGDLRNRLMALADTRLLGHPEVYRLFDTRLPSDVADATDATDPPCSELHRQLAAMVEGSDPLVAAVPLPLRTLIRHHLGYFVEHMPARFDLRGASIGNLILAGGYLNNRSDIDAVIFLFSKLVAVRGIVRPVVDSNLHLSAELADGTVVVGQHHITSREVPLAAPIRELRLTETIEAPVQLAHVEIDARTRELIAEAELICFPVGSFWTSVMACLLPRGVGHAVAGVECPKVYVPNCGIDPEELGLAPHDQVRILLDQLRRDAGEHTPTDRLLHLVLVDSERGEYVGGLDIDRIEALGVEVVDTPLISDDSAPLIEPRRLVELLLSLV
jgi:CofD-related protein of GAK system